MAGRSPSGSDFMKGVGSKNPRVRGILVIPFTPFLQGMGVVIDEAVPYRTVESGYRCAERKIVNRRYTI
jgi:hypothetical protein